MARRPLAIAKSQLQFGAPNRSTIANQIGIAPEYSVELPRELRFAFLCFTNRCGSAHFGDLLESTGVFGPALESLNAGAVLNHCEQHALGTFQDYFAAIVRRDTKDGVYIVKAAPEQLALLTEAGILDEIVERSAFLYIRRADTLGQAVSRVIAEQNRRWAWDSPSEMTDGELVFSAKSIAGHIKHITIQNQSFEQFFALNGLDPVRVEYERLLEDPQVELNRVARRLALPALRIEPSKLRYRQQRNEINDSWRSMFLAAEPEWDEVVQPRFGKPIPVTPPADRTEPTPVKVEGIAHIQKVADVIAQLPGWIGKPGSGLWMEGFSILPRQGLEPGDIRYCAVREPSDLLPWTSGGAFCGTRSLSLPLTGFVIALSEHASARYRCSYSATFTDGSSTGPVAAGNLCRSSTSAPLEAFRLDIMPVDACQAGGPLATPTVLTLSTGSR